MLSPLRGALNPLGYPFGASYLTRIRREFGSSLVALWPQYEVSGTQITDISGNGHNGTYSNVTLGQAGIGDGNTAAGYNGTAGASGSRGDVYSAGFAAAFNGAEGTLLGWWKVANAGVWADGTYRRLASFWKDNNNVLDVYKANVNNHLYLFRKGSTVLRGVDTTYLAGSTAWFQMAMTWSVSADAVRVYLNGTRVDASAAAIGAWVNGAMSSTNCLLGSNYQSGYGQVWSGSIGPVALGNAALSPAAIARLAVV
jgi:hypothetical protein